MQTSDACHLTAMEIAMNDGDAHRCLNAGACSVSPENPYIYTCACRSGYTGDRCEIRDPCAGSPCGDRGTCVAVPDNIGASVDYEFYCACHIDEEGAYSSCDPLLAGSDCHHTDLGDANLACPRSACSHGHGACLACNLYNDTALVCQNEADLLRGYTCVCAVGYGGRDCEHDINAEGICATRPCVNGVCKRKGGDGDFS